MCDTLPDHHEYDSEQLAKNAVTLHGLEYPHCGGVRAFSCWDHHHIGHVSKVVGDACKKRHAAWHRGVAPAGATLQESQQARGPAMVQP